MILIHIPIPRVSDHVTSGQLRVLIPIVAVMFTGSAIGYAYLQPRLSLIGVFVGILLLLECLLMTFVLMAALENTQRLEKLLSKPTVVHITRN